MISNASAVTASIVHLLEIMGNERETMRRRLDAAATLLSYETPEPVTEQTKVFLTALLEDHHRVRTDHRLEASRLLRKAEARKIVQQSARSAEADEWREVGRQLAIGRRRVKLVRADLWPAPDDWADDLLTPDPEPESA